MSGFEVIGVISAVISILDVSTKLYATIENSDVLPETLKDVTRRLPLARNTLQIVEEGLKDPQIDPRTFRSIKTIVKNCEDKAERLQEILGQLVIGPKASRLDRYRLAVRRLGKEDKVEKLMQSLLEDIQLLAANQAVKMVEDKSLMDELQVAIQTLSQTRPAIAESYTTISHGGTGDQMNNTGNGRQYNHMGSGTQTNAHTIYFGSPNG
jgi:hypothetical protein